MQSINFLGKRGSIYQMNLVSDHRLFLIALIAFGVTVVVFLALIGFNIYLSSTLQGVVKKQNDTKQSIITNQAVEAQYLLFSNKLKSIAEIFEKRNNKQQAINYLSNLFSDTGFIGGVTYDGAAQILSLTVDSASVFQLEQLVTKLESEEVRANFSSLNRSNIRRTDTGRYAMKLTVELKKKAEGKSTTTSETTTENAQKE